MPSCRINSRHPKGLPWLARVQDGLKRPSLGYYATAAEAKACEDEYRRENRITDRSSRANRRELTTAREVVLLDYFMYKEGERVEIGGKVKVLWDRFDRNQDFDASILGIWGWEDKVIGVDIVNPVDQEEHTVDPSRIQPYTMTYS
jgi:hypothetical protein